MYSLAKLKALVLNGGVEKSAYEKVVSEIDKSNRAIIKGFSLLACIALAVMFFTSLLVPSLSANTALYGGAFIVAAVIWLIALFPGKTNRALMLVDMYLFAASLLGLGIVLGTVLGPKEISATYIAFLLAVPQLLTDRPIRMHILIVISVIIFIVAVIGVKDPSTWSSDITNAVLFGVISIILCTYSISNRVSRFCMQEKIRFMAENDQLTGLRNRYCYELSPERAAVLESKAIYCVYVDVNGLHELNNTKGHEAGDRMLQYVASAMQHLFGENDTYRIGGDEFVAIGEDKTLEEVNALVVSLKQAVESAGYHIAAGVSFREKKGIEMNAIVGEAEKEMYSDKAKYYQQNGIDRRKERRS